MSATISPRTIETVRLEADGASGRACFYEVALERITDGWLVHKTSGTEGRKPHEERWFRDTEEDARRLLERIVDEKTRPNRASPRKYRRAS